MPFAELPDMQQVILTGSDAHMPSPYLDAAPRRSIQQSGEIRGRAAPLRKFSFLNSCVHFLYEIIWTSVNLKTKKEKLKNIFLSSNNKSSSNRL